MGTRKFVAVALVFFLLLVPSGSAFGGRSQQNPSPKAPAEPPQANPADVNSMDAIMLAIYDVISGPAGKKRDWNRFRSLFVHGARLVAVGHGPKGELITQDFSVEEYIARATPVFDRQGFYEVEVARHADTWAHISQVFSAYESRHAPNEKPFQRGINSFQLFNDGHRWWVVTIYWESETPEHPLPRKYRK